MNQTITKNKYKQKYKATKQYQFTPFKIEPSPIHGPPNPILHPIK